jgi:hypothetical protein
MGHVREAGFVVTLMILMVTVSLHADTPIQIDAFVPALRVTHFNTPDPVLPYMSTRMSTRSEISRASEDQGSADNV